ncbi:hypothetical protein E4656_19745 [Natronospirillum operosum]|uniref:Uncharacterized protein n=1 Tax=Natronospirillum operosum TaxID=2759953 RepID=A0A4Z0W0W1_9GAMM|nr:hypothetical protein [Natronospirillum operosum]TGG89973.1 hypothetical protein E4656_19745 [Natronospirillum operosum]
MMSWETEWAGHGIGMLIMLVIVLLPFWRITKKAGFSGFWSLLMFVPLANILFLYYLAFARWPNARR